jgi:hypothetical protein
LKTCMWARLIIQNKLFDLCPQMKTCMLNELVPSSKINSLIPAHKCWGTWPLFFVSKFKSETVREVTCLHHRAKIWSKLLFDPRENVKSPYGLLSLMKSMSTAQEYNQ